ncbi:MAG: Gp49 family protein [Dysosmobacter sp.]|nr:Gp49 family protein [Dysosmobacter sp.]
MDKYIGTKLIEAEPAWKITPPGRKPYIETSNNCDCESGSKIEDGYKVRYADGYESWSPKNVFERAYLKMTVNPNLRTDKTSISQEMVDDFIVAREVTTMGDKCTVVRAVLRNGFEIVESSACVSAENYDEKLGADICMKKIKDKVWFLLGFLLQTAVHGV